MRKVLFLHRCTYAVAMPLHYTSTSFKRYLLVSFALHSNETNLRDFRYHCFYFASGADFSNQCEGVFVSFYLTAAGLVQSI